MSTLSNNSASSGGGVFNLGGTLNVIDSTVAGNSAQAGGGIYNLGTLTAVNSTIAYNQALTAGGGGGLGNGSGATSILHNTIVALNTDGSGAGATPTTSPARWTRWTAAYNLIGDAGSSGGLTNGTNGNQVGVAPGLAAGLANNGGPTATIALLAGSPAINAGSNNLAVDLSGNPLLYDQRGPGFPRFAGGIVSIGAYQANVTSPTPTTVYVNTRLGRQSAYTGVIWTDGSVHVIGYDAFATIQSCHRTPSPAGGFVYVAPETDNEQLTISKSVTVTGEGTILAGSGTGVGFTVTTTGVTISGFTIENFATGVVVTSSGSLALLGDTIETNTNSSGNGGGISRPQGAVTITDGTISNNSAVSGAGIYNNGGQVTITASTLSNNTATSGGGGVDNESGQVTITGVTISNNSASGNGGGILNAATLTVVNTTIANNSAGHGGGIYNQGTLTSVNSTIAYNFISSGSNSGGGLDVGAGTAKLYNTIVALNTDGTGTGARPTTSPAPCRRPARTT